MKFAVYMHVNSEPCQPVNVCEHAYFCRYHSQVLSKTAKTAYKEVGGRRREGGMRGMRRGRIHGGIAALALRAVRFCEAQFLGRVSLL